MKPWSAFVLQPGENDNLWELFHENSKVERHAEPLSDEVVLSRMNELHDSLNYRGFPSIDLPDELNPLKLSLGKVIATRSSIRDMAPLRISMKELSTLLHYSYGVTQWKPQDSPRPSRAVPSAGALYPLEIFFHTAHVKGLDPGLYHYNPLHKNLRLLRRGEDSTRIAECLLQPGIGLQASMVIFITALFERSVFKYGDRGYRYTMLEAGHVAQNITLVCNGLGLASVPLGGFYDREIDGHLEVDGILHSTIYIAAVGKSKVVSRARKER